MDILGWSASRKGRADWLSRCVSHPVPWHKKHTIFPILSNVGALHRLLVNAKVVKNVRYLSQPSCAISNSGCGCLGTRAKEESRTSCFALLAGVVWRHDVKDSSLVAILITTGEEQYKINPANKRVLLLPLGRLCLFAM